MNIKETRCELIYLFIIMCGFSGLSYAHGDLSLVDSHANEDAYLADQARISESQAPNLFIDHWQQQFSNKLHGLSNSIVSELVNPAYAATNNPATDGAWDPVVTWPFAFASAANTPDGKILAWGGNEKLKFTGGTSTYSAILDPATNIITQNDHTSHALFCGMSVMLEDGRVLVAGGDTQNTASVRMTSTFNPVTKTWSRINDMHVGRWYNGAVALPNGNVFSAVGEPGSQYPEMWTEGEGWSYMGGASLQSAILNYSDIVGSEPKNWLPHLHLAPNGQVFHSGHTPKMHYIDMEGNGGVIPVSIANSWNTANTPSVLFNEGKILQAGGALYDSANTSTTKAALIDLNSPIPTRTLIPDMNYPRIYHNQVSLPNGEVMVIGGNTSGKKFSDKDINGISTSILTPEIWNPADQSWRKVAPHSIPRNYHSVALLLPNGKIWSGGGGLCNCSADHPNSQIYTPPYLFNADGTPVTSRPQITSSPSIVSYGQKITVSATSGTTKFTMIRMSSTTHALNSDSRFLNVPFTSPSDGQYILSLHTNPNIMSPGYWMLFALNDQGVPSIAKVIQVRTTNSPEIQNIDAQTTLANTNVTLNVVATDPNATTLTFGAAGLPSGLTINVATGQITGKPKTLGNYTVIVSATDGTYTVTTKFIWSIVSSQQPPIASSVFGGAGGTLFTDIVSADRSLTSINIRAGAKIESIQAVLNSGALTNHGGTAGTTQNVIWPSDEYLVRIYGVHGTQVGKIGFETNTGRKFEYYGTATSADSIGSTFDYTVPDGKEIVGFTGRASAYLDSIGVMYRDRLDANQPPVVTSITDQDSHVGDFIDLQVLATDPEGDPLTFSAIGLPAGLTISSTTGAIRGTLTTAAVKSVVINVQDDKNASSALNLKWTVTFNKLNFNPVTTAPEAVGNAVTLTASVTNGINPRYKWSFGDGTAETVYSTNATVNHTFTNPGLYPIKVTAIDDTGATSNNSLIQAIYLAHTAKSPTSSTNIMVDDGNRLWVVNQDNNTISAFNANTNVKLGEIAVGKAPREVAQAPDGRIWVTNKQGASVSIINPSTLTVVQTLTLPFASQPFGVAFAPDDSAAYIVLEATGKLLKLNPTNGAQLASLDIGANPRHLSVTADSSKVLVSRFITPPMPGEATANIDTSTKGGEVVIVNAATMTVNKTLTLQHSNMLDDTARGSGIPNYLGVPVISPDGLSAWVPSKQDNIKRGSLRNRNNLNFQNSVRAIASKINLSTFAEVYGERIDFDNSGIGSAAVYDRTGNYLFVALETTQEVAFIDAYSGTLIDKINVGRAPDGLAISADGKKLYVNNFMSRTVSVVDISGVLSWGDPQPPVVAQFTASNQEKLAANVLRGKQLFYDAKDLSLARDGYVSCAVCHNDGGHDGRVWDLTGFGEGLRNTIDLRGRSGTGHGILHWSGNFDEIQDFEGQIRNLAGGTGLMSDTDFAATSDTLGTPKAGKSADLDALAAYVGSLTTFANSPQRNADDTLTTEAETGKALFISANCTQCHGSQTFTDSPAGVPHNVGTIKPSSGKRLNGALTALDSPTLRDVWNTAPYLHDGSATTVNAAIRAHTAVTLTDTEITQVTAYVKQIGGSEPGLPTTSNTPPIVSISSPTTGSTVSGTSVAVTANANDSDGIAGVQFKLDGANLGVEDTTAPYATTWNTTLATNAAHTLTAVARDNAGSIGTSNAVTVTVSNTVTPALPDVVVTSLTYSNGVFTSTVKNQGSVATPSGIIIGVGYAVDGVFKTYGSKTTGTIAPGTSVTIGTSGAKYIIPNGTHTIRANADDAKRFTESDETNNTLSQTITVGGSDTTAPTVSISTPVVNSTVTGSAVNVAATAADNVAVAGVQFKLDGVNLGVEDTTAPYGITWNSTTVANGSHTLTAVARDTSNLTTTSSTVTVTVNNTTTDTTAPTVSISNPVANGTVTGAAVNVAATATDNVAVAGVQFKLDGVNLGVEDTTAPYGVTWNSTTVANGSHTLTAIARDTSNNTTTSSVVTVTVNNTTTTQFPDLIVTALSYGGGTFYSTVKNQGTVATPAGVTIGVMYSVDGVNRTWGATTTSLAPGASVNLFTSGARYVIPSGAHTISVKADDINRITESNEANNILSKSVTIP